MNCIYEIYVTVPNIPFGMSDFMLKDIFSPGTVQFIMYPTLPCIYNVEDIHVCSRDLTKGSRL